MRAQFKTIIFVIILICNCSAENTPTSHVSIDENLTVGALLPLHGDIYNHGISAQIALKMAESDINKLFSNLGRSIRVHVVVKDTQTDPDITLRALKELQAQGIRIIIGPEDSQSLSNVREYANENGIILISCASTAPSLAIKNDTTFRLAANDSTLAHLMSALMHRDGIKVLIPMARNDLWADDMLDFTKKNFESIDRKMGKAVRYDPKTTNFSRELKVLHSEVENAIENNGTESVAVYVSAFDEIVQIFSQAAQDQLLSSVKWYGNDLSAVAISRDKMASEFAVSINFLTPIFGLWDGSEYRRINDEVMNKTGFGASYFAANDYIALWLITYTYLVQGSDDSKAFKWLFPMVASTYKLDSSWMKLNEAGDLETVPYSLAYLETDNETYKWTPYAIL